MICLSGRRNSGTGLKILDYEFLSFETRKLEAGEKFQQRDSRERAGHGGAGRRLLGDELAGRLAGDWAARDGFRRVALHALFADRDHVRGQRRYGVRFGFLLLQG